MLVVLIVLVNNVLLFLTETFLSNYAHDNSLLKMGRDLEFGEFALRKDFITYWFYQDYMVISHKNCHYMYTGKNTVQSRFTFEDLKTIENKFIFHDHIKRSVEKVVRKSVLSPE